MCNVGFASASAWLMLRSPSTWIWSLHSRMFTSAACAKPVTPASPLQGILGYTDEPLVHLDIVGDPHSSIVDSLSTAVAGGRLATILAWYDNEAGYANRCVELARKLAS